MDTTWLEPGFFREAAQDEKGARARERPAARVEEELGAVALVEIRPPARQVAPQRLDGFASHRHDALLRALADAADDALLEIDARLVEADGLADAQACAVEELDERLVAERARRRSRRGVDQPLGLAGRKRARQGAPPPRQLDVGEVAAVRLDGLGREPRGREREEGLDLVGCRDAAHDLGWAES